jgi:hypothetical protein
MVDEAFKEISMRDIMLDVMSKIMILKVREFD